MEAYEAPVELGVKYTDSLSGFSGSCGAVCFYPDGPARAQLVAVGADGNVVREWFDVPALVTPGEQAAAVPLVNP